MSLGEIASEEGISRQGVADLIKRCNKKLLDYEAKLHLVEKFMSIKSDIRRIHELTNDFKTSHNELLMLSLIHIYQTKETVINRCWHEYGHA